MKSPIASVAAKSARTEKTLKRIKELRRKISKLDVLAKLEVTKHSLSPSCQVFSCYLFDAKNSFGKKRGKSKTKLSVHREISLGAKIHAFESSRFSCNTSF